MRSTKIDYSDRRVSVLYCYLSEDVPAVARVTVVANSDGAILSSHYDTMEDEKDKRLDLLRAVRLEVNGEALTATIFADI